ncbi:CsbD family protein [Desulfonatronum sp. SC1]|uniref:CsbD family protein n=1 Tax=Desulfonatronum sp. SC1 TaxID=2109626 RepID=UPI000D326CF6|nr:CsbD family protein [Desulfonatronum sp. SC1]PTN36326.1 CsbD family protein [Desulfonatronum sp. SC1]
MKSSTRDEAEGKMHQAKGKVKEVIGKAVNNPDMEAEGNVEKLGGVVQEKVGDVKRAVGK